MAKMAKLANTFQHFLNNKWINQFQTWFKKFVDSDLYIIFFSIVCLINWKFHLSYFALSIGIIFLIFIILFDVNRFRMIPLILSIVASLRLNTPNDYLGPALFSAIIIVPLVAFDLFRKKVFYSNQIFIGMIFLLIAMIFSLTNTPDFVTSLLGVLMMVVYMFLFLYLFNKKSQYDMSSTWLYIAKSFTYFGILILFETLIFNFEISTGGFLSFFNWKEVDLSWANTNYIAMIYLVIIPLTAFWYSQTQKHFYLIIVLLFEFVALVLLISRGSYLAILFSGFPFLIKFFSDVKNKIVFTQKALILMNVFLIILVIIAIPTGIVKDFYQVLNSRGLSLLGRELLYRIGFSVFSRYPLFGGGINSSEFYLSLGASSVYYHNFFIQTLATIGIIGLLAFAYYLYQMIRQSLLKCNYNNYIFFILLALIVHGLFDTTFYNPLIMILLSIILPLMLTNKEININNGKEISDVHHQSPTKNASI
ncbi:MAG: O-antigen ligase family protein [Bacilli bacterium]|nr:O-antigen ligase family protein [Bacilli bacterium]